MRRLQDRSHSFSSFPEFAPCKGSKTVWILDSTPWIPDSRYCNPDSLSGFLSLVGSGLLQLYSGCQSPGFRHPQAKISQIPLHGATESLTLYPQFGDPAPAAVEHWFNEVARDVDWRNLFVKSRVLYIEHLHLTNWWQNYQNVRYMRGIVNY